MNILLTHAGVNLTRVEYIKNETIPAFFFFKLIGSRFEYIFF